MCKGKEKDHKCPIIKHNKATKSGFDILEEDGRECTCVRSRRHFLSFVDVVCVNIFILWMLKYPNWQEKKNHWRCLYLLSLGEKMVNSHIRTADSANDNILTKPWEQCVSLANNQLPLQLWRKVEEDGLEGVLFVQQLRTEKQIEMLPVPEPHCQDNSNKMWQLQGIIRQISFTFLFWNVSSCPQTFYVFHYVSLHEKWKTRRKAAFCLWVYESNFGRKMLR